MSRTIGVALDYSASSKYALKWAVANVVREGDRLIVIVVHKEFDEEDGKYVVFGENGSPLIPLVEEAEESDQRQYHLENDEEVQAISAEAATVKKADVYFKVYWGDPKDFISKAANDIPLDFLVMGCRGLSALKRLYLGSVSNYVTNGVDCPVTIVKLPPNMSA